MINLIHSKYLIMHSPNPKIYNNTKYNNINKNTKLTIDLLQKWGYLLLITLVLYLVCVTIILNHDYSNCIFDIIIIIDVLL